MPLFGTGELSKRLTQELGWSVTRTVLFRLREQYSDRLPEPHRAGNNFVWGLEHLDAFKIILKEEARITGACA